MKRYLFAITLLCLVLFSGWKLRDNTTFTPLPPDDLKWNKQLAEAYVHSYATVLSEALKEIPADSLRVSSFLRKAISNINFYPDSSGYFYIYDYSCINIAHARQKELQGQNLYNYTDAKGKYVIRELAKSAKGGGGYVEYYWIKPGEKGEKKKLGYVEPIPNSNFFIGSGVYLE